MDAFGMGEGNCVRGAFEKVESRTGNGGGELATEVRRSDRIQGGAGDPGWDSRQLSQPMEGIMSSQGFQLLHQNRGRICKIPAQ